MSWRSVSTAVATISIKLHCRLWDRHRIKPVIGIRNTWQSPEGHDGTRAVDTLEGVAYDWQGNVSCYNCYGMRQKMAHAGFENHTLRGIAKMELRPSIAYMAMPAMCLGCIRNKQEEQLRSLLHAA